MWICCCEIVEKKEDKKVINLDVENFVGNVENMFRSKEEFKEQYTRRLVESFGCAVEDTHPTEKYMVLGKMVRDYANVNWKDTKVAIKHTQAKEVYYFSIEFFMLWGYEVDFARASITYSLF